jgi:hypothetical protein
MEKTRDERIKDLLAEFPGSSAADIAMWMTEDDVVAGEYEGCSDELDLAAMQYESAATRIICESR